MPSFQSYDDLDLRDQALIEEIVALRRRGLSTVDIGNKVDLDGGAVGAVLEREGFDLSNNTRALTPRECREVARRYEEGWETRQELADDYGVSVGAISNVIRRQGV